MTPRFSLALTLLATFGLTVPTACQCASRAGSGTSSTGGASSGPSTSSGSTGTASASTTAPAPDLPTGCEPERYGECDPWCQDCPEGQKCLAWVDDGGDMWNATRCSPVAPDPQAPGQPCTTPEGPDAGLDNCEKGAMCWEVDLNTNNGTCSALCTGSPDSPQCPPYQSCLIASDGFLNLCRPWCNPLVPADCWKGSVCLLTDVDLIGPPGDAPPFDPDMVAFKCTLKASGPVPQGTPCQFANVCDPGLACVNATRVPNCDPDALPGCCARWCDLAQPDCPEGGTCQPVLQPAPDLPQELANLGLCLLP